MSGYTGAANCAELPETANEEYDDENGLMSASVTLRCDYGDRHTVAGDICANRRQWPKGSFGLVPRASRASIKAEMNLDAVATAAAGGQLWVPKTALVTVYYSTKTADIITESLEPTAEFLTLDHKQFAWGSGNGDALLEEEAPGFLVRGIGFVRTSYYVQPPLDGNLLALNGFINENPFSSTLLTLTFDAQTLLFCPPVVNRKVNSNGLQQFDVVKKWVYKPQGWNVYYRARDNAWLNIYLRGAGTPHQSYPVGDISSLLSW